MQESLDEVQEVGEVHHFFGELLQQHFWSKQGTPEVETRHLCSTTRLHQPSLAEEVLQGKGRGHNS